VNAPRFLFFFVVLFPAGALFRYAIVLFGAHLLGSGKMC
jgi:hypothetical protein